MRRSVFLAAAVLAALQATSVPAAAAAVPGTTCNAFPANNIWNTDISGLPVNANNAAWLAATGAAGRNLHPDFGPSGDPSNPYGIPFAVVDSSHPRVNVAFQYANESDRVPYPLGPDTPIEGGPSSTGDRHALMLDRSNCNLYELYDTHYSAAGSTAGSGAVFNLNGNALRPAGWTSADAAGLPIFPGLLRLDEVNSGAVNHAIRFTVQRSAAAFLWPARHQAGSGPVSVNPPMGARFRMKAGVSLVGFSPKAKVILSAFQHYGLIVADNGSNWYFQGDANNAWPDSLISELKRIPASDFEAVDESSLMIDPNSAQARQPGGGGGVPPPPVKVPPAPVTAPLPPAAAAATEQASAPPGAAAARFAQKEEAMTSVIDPVSRPQLVTPGRHAAAVARTGGRLAATTEPGPVLPPWWLMATVAGALVLAFFVARRRRSAPPAD